MYNIWNELSEDSKKAITEEYSSLLKRPTFKFVDELTIKERIKHLEELFGKENLVPEPLIKTWKDVAELYPYLSKYIDDFDTMYLHGTYIGKVINKIRATAKIAKLIELGYGGIITDEEWNDKSIYKYALSYHTTVCSDGTHWAFHNINRGTKYFIAFHAPEQRDAFLKYNEQLCKDYYMV